ncbi:MAG: SIMPL domain-containing protein [Actinobacteria bacterium]|nr:SIMPL domain-containing protein [Actinomycetota bacterium]MBO0885598.1 SIMPL domain-containing protein [Mycobacterium sp.]
MIRMQLVERPWGVAAYGAASVKAMPDLVRVRFKVVRIAPTPSQSFAQASDSVHAVREVLRRHGIPDQDVERSHLGLTSAWSGFGPDRKFLGYSCHAAFAVESKDLDDVQRLLVDVVAAGANEIEGVDFDVTTKADLRAEARRQAVVAARNKATLYAEAAGCRLGHVVHIDDVDPENAGFERYRAHAMGGEASAEDLAPGHVVVSAAVILGFSIIHD